MELLLIKIFGIDRYLCIKDANYFTNLKQINRRMAYPQNITTIENRINNFIFFGLGIGFTINIILGRLLSSNRYLYSSVFVIRDCGVILMTTASSFALAIEFNKDDIKTVRQWMVRNKNKQYYRELKRRQKQLRISISWQLGKSFTD